MSRYTHFSEVLIHSFRGAEGHNGHRDCKDIAFGVGPTLLRKGWWPDFPFPRTDSSRGLGEGYAKCGEAIEHCNPDLELGHLPLRHQHPTRQLGAVRPVRRGGEQGRGQPRLAEINWGRLAQTRHAAERDALPTAGEIDSRSVKSHETTRPSASDAGKRIKGSKRHIITDTCGNLIACEVHSAGIQDRDGAPGVLAKRRREAHKLRHMATDGGYSGPKLRDALVPLGRCTLQIVKRSDTAKRIEVLPRRRVVEHTCAWLGRCRRPAPDWKKPIESAKSVGAHRP